jgi:hypothetical protein
VSHVGHIIWLFLDVFQPFFGYRLYFLVVLTHRDGFSSVSFADRTAQHLSAEIRRTKRNHIPRLQLISDYFSITFFPYCSVEWLSGFFLVTANGQWPTVAVGFRTALEFEFSKLAGSVCGSEAEPRENEFCNWFHVDQLCPAGPTDCVRSRIRKWQLK